MNKLILIGNLTRDPQLRTVNTANGTVNVCSFSLAVNDRKKDQNGEQRVNYFNVTAWRGLGEICSKYLAKGRKACVTGSVSVRTYQANDGSTRASLEVTAEDVEFLSSRSDVENGAEAGHGYQSPVDPAGSGFQEVDSEDLPF